MEGGKVPSYFLCPISLDIMRDPVTMQTGITYDRASIERWIFMENHVTCPVSKQAASPDSELTPNHTLRRLIQAWCAANASFGVERFPTPKPPVDRTYISRLVDEGSRSPGSKLSSLRKLRDVVSESDRNRRCVQSCPDAVDFLASTINGGGEGDEVDEALIVLYSLKLSVKGFGDMLLRNSKFVESVTKILGRRSNENSRSLRGYAMMVLKSLMHAEIGAVNEEVIREVVRVLRDRISYQVSKAALKVLAGACPWGRNRARVADAGAVGVIVEQLLDEPERRATEMMLDLLRQLCMCAEGRVELLRHAAGIAVVSKKMVRVSPVASKMAVGILHAVAGKQWAAAAVVEELLQVGAVANMCLLLQMDCGGETVEKVKDLLRVHGRAWKSSPCFSPHFQTRAI